MKRRHAATCARCGNVGTPYQLIDLLEFDRNQLIVALCDRCLRLLKYADARTWEWFRKYRDQLSWRMRTGQRGGAVTLLSPALAYGSGDLPDPQSS